MGLDEHTQDADDALTIGAALEALRHAAEGWPTPNHYTVACDFLVSRLASLEAEQEKLRERDDWLVKQLDGLIEDAQLVADHPPDVVGAGLARSVVRNLRDARAALAGTADTPTRPRHAREDHEGGWTDEDWATPEGQPPASPVSEEPR